MKAILVDYDVKSDKITIKNDAEEMYWVTVCEEFNDDVHRIRGIRDMDDYTGLYECIDDDNKSSYYIVEEDSELYRVKHRHFLDSIGLKK